MIQAIYRSPGLLALVIALLGFLSFDRNALWVAGDRAFEQTQIDSEQLVLDGLTHARLLREAAAATAPAAAGLTEDDPGPGMGRYSRPGLSQAHLQARTLYDAGDTEGEFSAYRSQFGLQFHALDVLSRHVSADHRVLQGVVAGLMAATVALLFAGLVPLVGPAGALAFALVLVLSPWVVVFARNLYWVPFTWFLPALLTVWGAGWAMRGQGCGRMAALAGATGLAFLGKFLCGYEFATTVVIAAFVPILLSGLLQGIRGARITGMILATGAASLVAFCLAVGMHAAAIGPDLSSGLAEIGQLAAKRSNQALCDSDCVVVTCKGDQACADQFSKSLSANPATVVLRYFALPDFLPWLARVELQPQDRQILGELLRSLDFAAAGDDLVPILLRGFPLLAGVLAFTVFNLLTLRVVLRRGPTGWTTLLALIGSLSWFVIAKGHSAIHYHVNYVLWYLVYIPTAAMALMVRKTR